MKKFTFDCFASPKQSEKSHWEIVSCLLITSSESVSLIICGKLNSSLMQRERSSFVHPKQSFDCSCRTLKSNQWPIDHHQIEALWRFNATFSSLNFCFCVTEKEFLENYLAWSYCLSYAHKVWLREPLGKYAAVFPGKVRIKTSERKQTVELNKLSG